MDDPSRSSPPTLVESLAEAVPVWLVTRLAVLLVGYAAVMAIGFPARPPWTMSDVPAFDLVARWDSAWYLSIAQRGYTWPPTAASGQSEIAFFPLYPLAMRFVGFLLGGRVLLAGWMVSMGACLAALVYFHRLARLHLDPDRSAAAVLLLAAYPFAVYYSALYTESLFLLCMVAAVYHAWRRQAGPAAVWGVLAGLARPTGFIVAVVVGLIALAPLIVRRVPWSSRWLLGSSAPATLPNEQGVRPALLAASIAPVLGLGLYSAHIYRLTGNPFAWTSLLGAWGKSISGLPAIADTLRAIYSLGFVKWSARPIDALNELAVLFVIVAVWPVLRRFGLAYALLMVLVLLPALMSGGVRSLGRYSAPLFPLFLWLGAAVPARRQGLVVFAFALLQALVAALFFTWRPMM